MTRTFSCWLVVTISRHELSAASRDSWGSEEHRWSSLLLRIIGSILVGVWIDKAPGWWIVVWLLTEVAAWASWKEVERQISSPWQSHFPDDQAELNRKLAKGCKYRAHHFGVRCYGLVIVINHGSGIERDCVGGFAFFTRSLCTLRGGTCIVALDTHNCGLVFLIGNMPVPKPLVSTRFLPSPETSPNSVVCSMSWPWSSFDVHSYHRARRNFGRGAESCPYACELMGVSS